MTQTYDPELELLGLGANHDIQQQPGWLQLKDVENAPLLTGEALDIVGDAVFPQRTILGRILGTRGDNTTLASQKLYINTNTPYSGVICGVQGSGKSHSTAVFLESSMIQDPRLGVLPEPLAGLLFHYDTAAGTGQPTPCEAAYVASLDPLVAGDARALPVTVLVLPTMLNTMKKVYARFTNVKVAPLHLISSDLTCSHLLSIMKVDMDDKPLYMESVMAILRTMNTSTFSYTQFRRLVDEQNFSKPQKAMLDLRLGILDSCLKGGTTKNCVSRHFEQGTLVIIDLTSPFMDSTSACDYFDLILWMFIETPIETWGKIIVLDEAHKYLNGNTTRFTESLLSVIRLQRHLGTRLLISTQEPTIVPENYLSLCSFIIAHRFSSQKWLDYLKSHVPTSDLNWLDKVLSLQTGEALVFAPSSLTVRSAVLNNRSGRLITPLGKGYLHICTRKRITADGGLSVIAIGIPDVQTINAFTPFEESVSQESAGPIPESHNNMTQAKLEKSLAFTPGTARSISPIDSRFMPLVSFLRECSAEGDEHVQYNRLAPELRRTVASGDEAFKLGDYLNEAAKEGLITFGPGRAQWVQLASPCTTYIPRKSK